MGIAEALRRLTDAELERFFTLRPELADPPPGTFSELSTRAATPYSIQALMMQLDAPSVQVLDALAYLGQPASAPDVAALARENAPTDKIAATLDHLRVVGLIESREISGSEPLRWVLTPAVRRIVAMPFGLQAPLAKVLERFTVNDLRSICHNLRIEERMVAKVGLIADITKHFAVPGLIQLLIETAPHDASSVLERVEELGGAIPLDTRPWAVEHIPEGVRWLLGHALLVPANGEMVVVPREVALAMRGGSPLTQFDLEAPAVVTAAPRSASSTPRLAELAPPAIIDLVAAIASSLERTMVVPLRNGGVAVKDVRALAKQLGVDDMSMARLMEIAGVAGLLSAESYAPRVAPTKLYDEWLTLPSRVRWLRLVEAWACSAASVSRVVPTSNRERGEAPLSPTWFSDSDEIWRRARLIDALAQVDHGLQPDFGTVVMRAVWPSPSRWLQLPNLPEAAVMLMAEAALLGVVCDGALSGIGRAALLGTTDDLEVAAASVFPPSVDTFTVQGDLTAIAPGELDPVVSSELALMAAIESKGAATVYRFSEASLRRAFDVGRTATELLAFLDRHAQPSVPQPLRYLVDDVARRYGSLRAGTAVSYVRSDDPALIADLMRAKKTGKLKLRQVAPTVVVSSLTMSKLLAGLREAGFLPVEEDAAGAVIEAVGTARTVAHPGSRPRVQAKASAIWSAVRGTELGASEASATGHGPLVRRLRRADPSSLL